MGLNGENSFYASMIEMSLSLAYANIQQIASRRFLESFGGLAKRQNINTAK
jgi:hypothetical protein